MERLDSARHREILAADVKSTLLRLGSVFPEWNTYPEPVQVALVDMAFNLGVPGLVKKFPSFVAAVKSRDWAGASRECRRRGISEARNAETERLFAEAC